jgi:hypothetical protein
VRDNVKFRIKKSSEFDPVTHNFHIFYNFHIVKLGNIFSTLSFVDLAPNDSIKFSRDFKTLWSMIDQHFLRKATTAPKPKVHKCETSNFAICLKESFTFPSNLYFISAVSPYVSDFEENKHTLEEAYKLFQKTLEADI